MLRKKLQCPFKTFRVNRGMMYRIKKIEAIMDKI